MLLFTMSTASCWAFLRRYVADDHMAFLVDDLWCAFFYFLGGKEVRSFRDNVLSRRASSRPEMG